MLIHNQEEGLIIQGQLADGVMVEGVAGYSLDEDFAFDVSVNDFPVETLYSLSLSEQNVEGRISGTGLYWQRSGVMGGDFDIATAKLTWSDKWLELRKSTNISWNGEDFLVEPFNLTGLVKQTCSLMLAKKGLNIMSLLMAQWIWRSLKCCCMERNQQLEQALSMVNGQRLVWMPQWIYKWLSSRDLVSSSYRIYGVV